MPIISTNTAPKAEPNISAPALFEAIGFKPHSRGQHDYLYSQSRFCIPVCGRRWGKSLAAGHRMTYKSFIPDTYNWIVGPTYTLAEKEFRVVYEDYKRLGFFKYKGFRAGYSKNQGVMYITTPWNSHVIVVSADRPDSLLGEGLSHVIMSEAARHNRETWEQFIEPALSDLRGSADFPTTPKGYNWIHGMYELGQQPEVSVDPLKPYHSDSGLNPYKSWTFPTWDNTVRYPGGFNDPEIQRVKEKASKHWFDQEYGASFTVMTGVIYPEFEREKHVKKLVFNPDWSNYLAYDFGFANPFVCLDIGVDSSDNVYVWREYYQTQTSTHEHGQYLINRSNPPGYHIDGQFGDPRGADEIATLALTIGFVAAIDVPWKHGVEEIKRMLLGDDRGPKLFIDESCVNLIRSISQLKVKEVKTANSLDVVEMGANGTNNIQHKVDDHAADALRYFIGPFFVLGAGSHLADVYGADYHGSESSDFFTLHSSMHLGQDNNSLLRI